MPRARRLLAWAIVTVAACSGGDDDDAATTTGAATTERRDERVETGGSDRAAFVAPLAANLRAANDALDEDHAECLAEAVVDTVGIGRLAGSGMTPEEFADGNGDLGEGRAFAPQDQDALSAALAACGDLVDVFVVDEDLSREVQACIRGMANDRIAAELMAADLTGATPSDEAREAAAGLRDCVGADAPTTTIGRPTTTSRADATTTTTTFRAGGPTTTSGADPRNRD